MRLLIILLCVALTSPAQAWWLVSKQVVSGGSPLQTDVYVDPDATGAGDGTSWTDAYTSLFAAEAAEESILTQPMVIHCRSSAGTADSTQVTIDGWTTSPSNYLKIVVEQADRHDGKWDNTAYRLEITGTPYDPLFVVNEPYVWVDGLQFKYNTDRPSTYNAVELRGAGGWQYFSNNIVVGNNIQGSIDGITTTSIDANDNRYIWNNIVTVDGKGFEFVTQFSPAIYAYSNTSISQSDVAFNRVYNSNGTVALKNNYAHSATTYAYNTSSTWNVKTTCASSDTTGSAGLQNIAYATDNGSYFSNVSVGLEDLHISSASSSLIDEATDTSGESTPLDFATDIDGETRVGWDVGADEN